MEKFVVTITRQFGSLGRPIARRLSELLEIEYYDRDIVEETARKMNKSVSVISQEEERMKSKYFFMSYPLGMGAVPDQRDIFQVQSEIINTLADTHSCIIVGRCSDYVLRNHKNAIHVYIYAPYEERVKNCVESLGMDRETAVKMIREVDRARETYHKYYAGYAPEDGKSKDIMMNSARLGVEGTARELAAMVRTRFEKG